MAIYTPHGLKIRIPLAYAFALMARLFPRVDGFHVLQLTEQVDNLTSLATFIAGVVVFAAGLHPITLAVVITVTCLSFRLSHFLGLFIPPFKLLLPLSRVYSWFSGYGVLLAALLLLGFLTVGWQGVVAFVVSRVAATGLAEVIELLHSKSFFRKHGIWITASERSFFHAYRLLADRVGVTRSLEVADAEMEPEQWQAVYEDLTIKWPVVTARFTPD